MLASLARPSVAPAATCSPPSTPLAAVLTLWAVCGCGPSVPTFPRYDLDAGIECDDQRSCSEGEVCLQGRCYLACTGPTTGGADAPLPDAGAVDARTPDASLPAPPATICGPGETCVMGVCRGAITGDAGRDGGTDAPPIDAPPDPCVTARCGAPTPYCIPGTGICVACQSQSDCGGLTPICDLGRGACVAVDTVDPICAPCNNDPDCLGMGTCTTRDGGTFRERVCLPSEAAGCPPGMTTSGAPTGLCVPVLSQSCRNYVTARQRAPCVTAADCVPIGAPTFGDVCPAAECLFPCGSSTDCPPGLTVCDAMSYCSP